MVVRLTDPERVCARYRRALELVGGGATCAEVAGEFRVWRARAHQIVARAYRLEQEELGVWRGWPGKDERVGHWRVKLIRGA